MTKIPDQTKMFSLTENQNNVKIDTKGLDCIIKPNGADVFVMAKDKGQNSKNDAFIVRDGEEMCFCGKISVFSESACEVYCMFYRTL